VDFEWSDDQRNLYQACAAFARAQLNDDVVGRDRRHDFSRHAWEMCAKFGIQGLPVPAEFGGGDADPVTLAICLEALGYGCKDGGLLFSLGAHLWSAVTPLWRFGTVEQKQRWLPGLCDGSLIGVGAMTEPGTGSDAFAMTTSARLDGDHYVLHGGKTFITNAPVADLFLVFATTAATTTVVGGLGCFVVERGTPGLTIGKPFRKMGLHTSPMSEIFLDNCVVDADQMLGSPGAGMAIFNTSMDWERSFILAPAVGTMQRHFEQAVAYAKDRHQFGQPIGSYQAISHRIVNMRLRLDAARLLLYRAAEAKARGRSTRIESSAAKLFISEALVASSHDLLHIHGAYGYMEESGIERELRDAIASTFYSGTSDIQRNIIASRLGL
jgi:alkylation response protein AidB-like acyl-CoA dehydrogenase